MRIRNVTEAKQAKVSAELVRGMGYFGPYDYPVDLEPPFEPFRFGQPNELDLDMLGIDTPFEANPIKRLFKSFTVAKSKPYVPEPLQPEESLVILQLTFPSDLETTPLLAEQFIVGLMTSEPVSFEVVGTAAGITFQLACPESRASQIARQLEVQYPQLSVLPGNEQEPLYNAIMAAPRELPLYYYDYCLDNTHCHPIGTYRNFQVDPLSLAVSALSNLSGEHWGVVQVLWQPVRNDWTHNIQLASRNEYDPSKPAFYDYPDLKACAQKVAKPLFAVGLRVATSSEAAWKGLEGYLQQFTSAHNCLVRCADTDMDHDRAARRILSCLLDRVSFRFGMLLNSEELAGLVHLPSPDIICDKLPRILTRTAPAPARATGAGIVLGENVHRGQTQTVRVPLELRNQHMYLIGATRTGKTTLMLTMIIQDMAEGRGVAVIDPHGDLTKEEILPRIPEGRVADVVYLNPDDREYPVAFNVLQSRTQSEKELLCNDLVVVFQRLFGDSWGMRLEHILRYLLLTLLERPGSTLRDVRRLIDDERFRGEVIPQVKDPEVRDFWEYEFATYGNNAFSPIRNKLGKFLAYRTVRNMLLQPETKIEFSEIMDSGKILLCNLSQGQLGEEVSNILGALLVSRLQIAAMARAGRPMAERRDFYLYVDEFQNYITSSFEKILSEAGKYRLNLILANQFLKQLPEKLQSAILDNVGSLLCFRTGVDVANRLAKELGDFTSQDIANLKRGEVIVRLGASRDTFNLKTSLPPAKPAKNYEAEVIANCRQRYATPRTDVEKRLEQERQQLHLDSLDDFYE